MAWKTDWYNLVGLAGFVEFGVDMALMPIKHKHPVLALLTRFCLSIKVFKLLKAYIIISLAVRSYLDDLTAWNVAAKVPGSKVELTRNVEERRYCMSICRNGINRCDLFSITRLDSFWFIDSI
jgi:hypothetical protein